MPPLMTDEELAARLKVPVSWVRDAAKAGRIPCTWIGKHRRYAEAHYEQIVSDGERPVATAGGRRGGSQRSRRRTAA